MCLKLNLVQLALTLAAIAALSPFAQAGGETITVDTTADWTDFDGAQQIADLPGPDWRVSFREACIAANNTPGPQTIAFNIPIAPEMEWWGGSAMLFMDYSVFVLSDDATTVDFSTQTAFTGDTNPAGNEVALRCAPLTGAPAIIVGGNHCVIRGLDRAYYVGYAVELMGNDNRVVGCTISGPLYAAVYITGGFQGVPPTGNIVGGTLPGEGNRLSGGDAGVRIDGPADGNMVIGNPRLSGPYAGVQVRSNPAYGMYARNTRIGGPTPAERNVISGAGFFGEEGFPGGAQVSLEQAIDTLVEGNYIGTNEDGSAAAVQYGTAGIAVSGATGTTIRNNVISGIAVSGVNHAAGQRFGVGISVGAGTWPVVEGNLIGTDASGAFPIPNRVGIGGPLSGVTIGGPAAGQGNTIAFNELNGVLVGATSLLARISGNSIHDNGALGIDLIGTTGAGVTPNDPLDTDGGGNNLQNYPVLTGATSAGSSTSVRGTLGSLRSTAFTLEFFANAACDPSGFGEGEIFLGSTQVMTAADGNAVFDVTLPAGSAPGSFITATATDPYGNTSEFSACLQSAAGGFQHGDMNCDGTLNPFDIQGFITALIDPSGYGQQYPNCDWLNADTNLDGTVNAFDIQSFMELLGG